MTIRELLVGLGFKINEESERQAEQGISDLKDKATQLLGAIGIGFSLVGLNAISEEFSTVNTMINQATQAMGDQKEIQRKSWMPPTQPGPATPTRRRSFPTWSRKILSSSALSMRQSPLITLLPSYSKPPARPMTK